ncbi:MAG: hypothetical protein VX519_05105 [Myxococcota bacterium]|nr:hypothetical protein [Myxococcota bacterium]
MNWRRLLFSLVAWAMPAVALACPVCAGREDAGNARVIILGSMIAFPFLILPPVYRLIKKGGADLPY